MYDVHMYIHLSLIILSFHLHFQCYLAKFGIIRSGGFLLFFFVFPGGGYVKNPPKSTLRKIFSHISNFSTVGPYTH